MARVVRAVLDEPIPAAALARVWVQARGAVQQLMPVPGLVAVRARARVRALDAVLSLESVRVSR